ARGRRGCRSSSVRARRVAGGRATSLPAARTGRRPESSCARRRRLRRRNPASLRRRAQPNAIRPDRVLGFGPMRLRTLSEAECYARCYGGRSDERVNVVRLERLRVGAPTVNGEQLRELFEERLDAHGPELEAA